MGIGDQSHRTGEQARVAPDALGELNLVAGTHRNPCTGHVATGRGIHEVDPPLAKNAGELHGLFDVPATLAPVRAREANEKGKVGRPYDTYRVDDPQHEPDAVFEAPAICVCARVTERRKKLVQQVAVGTMEFHDLESSGQGTLRGKLEVVDNAVDVASCHCDRNRRAG